ncbi:MULTISPECIES: SH3 domain-containing protein [Streptomyces]|uniref:SH3 domain-containing protein n=1 Tax=Streptomyces solicathayae TaxID=3081768 RepID=A0ABZ0LWK2_9ACTN|nr:SH3 domain-containing protein [Streptomyces sp. HUAS YS2]WOX23891.1 SH3 domain-containing protein [Streptomyces sp. HUAS YS2]
MKRRLAAVLPAVAMAALAVPMTSATPAFAAAPCGKTAPDLDGRAWNKTANGANMRSGSSTSCTILGVAYNTQALDYHCFTRDASGQSWTYLRNDATGKYGWVRDDLLSDYGSSFNCNF